MSERLTGAALERFELEARLESIFMPYARRQRDKFYDSGAKRGGEVRALHLGGGGTQDHREQTRVDAEYHMHGGLS